MKLAHFTGGRPMTFDGFAFTDVVVNQPVCYWRDTFGRRWLAFGAWSLFRVEAAALRLDEAS